MAIKFFAFFFPTISTFGCFWSQWPTSLAVTSGREGVRTTSFKPWRPHRGSCRGATAIEENNGNRREQWLTSFYAPAVWAQRCGAGGCRREATWIISRLQALVKPKNALGETSRKVTSHPKDLNLQPTPGNQGERVWEAMPNGKKEGASAKLLRWSSLN